MTKLLIAVLQVLALVVSHEHAQAATVDAVYVGSLGGGLRPGLFNQPRGIAIDATDRIFVADTGFCRIQAFDTKGNFLYAWGTVGDGPGQFRRPSAVAVDGDGHVYVTDAGNNRIQVFTREGVFVRTWGSAGAGPGQLNQPQGIALDRDGNVYVADSYNYRVQVYSSDGRLLRGWGSKGSGNGQFFDPELPSRDGAGPWGIAVGGDGTVYVTDPWNFRVQAFTNSGTFLRAWGHLATPGGQFNTPVAIEAGRRGGALNTPTGIAVDREGRVLVVTEGRVLSYGAYSVQRFDASGAFLDRWGKDGSDFGQFREPAAVAVDRSGNVYVVEVGNNRVQKFKDDGASVQLWGMVGDALLRRPTGLALDADGNLYVADSGTRKVKKFNASGEFLTQWEPAVPAYTTQFLSLSRIAVDRAGRVLLIDTGPGGVEMFSRDGKFLGVGVRPTRPGGKFLGNHAVDDEGNLYLIEHGRREPWSRVRVLSSQGKELARWDADHESVGGFNEYINIAVDAAHRVFVINWRKCRIEVFSSTGVPLGRWGSCGFGAGQFGEAEAIAISATGKVYVSDYTYNRVQMFQVR